MKKRMFVVVLLIFLLGSVTPVWALFCQQCGTKNVDEARFCYMCGKPLHGTKIEPTTSSKPDTDTPGRNVLAAPPSPQAFQVTSRYLLVNGTPVHQKCLFWVAEVRGEQARIWSVNEFVTIGIVMGWVSLAELEKRTTLRLDGKIQCVEPPPPTSEIVVIKSQPYWREWYPKFHFYSKPRRHRGGYHRPR